MTAVALLTVHRYWLTASLMRQHFRRYIRDHRTPDVADPDLLSSMGVWYATLYVAAEGWFSFQQSDETLDRLRRDRKFHLLKDFRDGFFHVQNEYIGDKLVAFMEVDGSAEWVEDLHREVGATLVRELESQGSPQMADVLELIESLRRPSE